MGVIHRKLPGKYEWENTDLVTYDKPTVKGVSKRVLIGPKDGAWGAHGTRRLKATRGEQ